MQNNVPYMQGRRASTGPRSGERGDFAGDAAVDFFGSASTGPRSGERGDIRCSRLRTRPRRLQRGRAPESAEIASSLTSKPRRYSASTGPRSGERGDIPRSCWRESVHPASTGPRSGERGDHGKHGEVSSLETGFNGAALRRARRCFRPSVSHPRQATLQRGRAPESAEINLHVAKFRRGTSRFNGAALRRARRWHVHRRFGSRDQPSFNGAALRRARR